MNNYMKLGVIGVLSSLPMTAFAQNVTDIYHRRGYGVDAFINAVTGSCSDGGSIYDYVDVSISEEGYKETGNVNTDKFKQNAISISIAHSECDPSKSYYLNGYSDNNLVKVSGNGRKVTISGSAAGSIPLSGQYFDPNGTPITDTVTSVTVEAEGQIVFSMDSSNSITSLLNGKYEVKQSSSSDNGPATKLKVALSTANRGSVVGPWAGSVNRWHNWTMKLTHSK